MALAAGSRLGPYEILAPLGAGGMGEVYRARDARLGREIAIKTLPSEFTADTERLARFEREARLLAALNHPNVAGIYGLEESASGRFLVLELVEGDTLAEKLAAGPLPVDEALAVCRQIAQALEAAHEKGIVHRDLKPANVKITPTGKVKVLDFGLAKALGVYAERSGELSLSPTVTTGGTHQGVILGTAPYMSPEQARGKPVDKRTDIWSFGCVLYEVLSGRRAFEGETVSDVMVSILSREPDWTALPANVAPRIRDLLRRCLRKDPERRLHDVADARLEIEEAEAEPDPAAGPAVPVAAPPSARRALRFGTLIASTLTSAALAALVTWRLVHRPAATGLPQLVSLARITQTTGRSEWPSWSPDGNLLAYSSNRTGDFEIYVRRGEGGQDVKITNEPAQDVQPAFSPDGNTIAFVSTRASRTGLIKIGGSLARSTRTYGGDLWVAPALGGPARRIAPDANFPVWRPDGRGIFYVAGGERRRSILEVSPDGGTPRVVLPSERSRWEIDRIGCSPNGRWVSFETELEEVFVVPSGGGEPRRLLTGSVSHAWDGVSPRLYYVNKAPQGGTRIQFVEMNLERGEPLGAGRTLSLVTTSLLELEVSRDGRRVAVREEEASRNLTRLPLADDGGAPAGPEEALSTGRVTDSYPDTSPDGRRIAYVSDILGHPEIWVLDLPTGRRDRLQLPGRDRMQINPVWMPDGRRLLISRIGLDDIAQSWIVAVDGSQSEELFRRGKFAGPGRVLQPSRDGKRLLYTDSVGGVEQVSLFDFGSHRISRLTDSPGDKYDTVWSPDGRWIALTAFRDGVIQLFRMPATGGAMQQLTTGYERMRHPFFSRDGRWIYIQPSHRNIYRVRAEGGPLEQVTRFPEAGLFLEEPTLSADGRYLVYCRENGGSSLWLLTLKEGGSL